MRAASGREPLSYWELAAAFCAAGLLYFAPGLGGWPLLLPAAVWLVGLVGHGLRRWTYRFFSSLDGWVLLFLFTAAMALWVTYNPGLGLTVFGPAGNYKFVLILGAAALYGSLSHLPNNRSVWMAAAVCGLLGAAVALFFLLTNDFAAQSAKFPELQALGSAIQHIRPALPGHALHPNVAGGLIAFFFPALLQTALGGWRRFRGRAFRRALRWASGLCLGVAALGLLLSESRGAWLGLAAALVAWGAWAGLGWWLDRRGASPSAAYRARALSLALVGLAGLAAFFLFLPSVLAGFPAFPGGDGSLVSRADLMQDSLRLAADAPFTGSGLGTFPWVYSTYVLLIHVPFISHAHNLFLDLLIAQGGLGLIALLGLVAAGLALAYRLGQPQHSNKTWPFFSVLGMACVAGAHGLVDDALYGSRGVLFWWIPFGLIAAMAAMEGVRLPNPFRQRGARMAFVAAAVVLIGIIFFYRSSLLAAWEANLGVVDQTKAELGLYDPAHFDRLTLDQARRQVDLSAAVDHFQLALTFRPGQVTARQRLAEIALSRADYPQAQEHTERLWAQGSRDRVTRILYASALTAVGQVEKAAGVVQGISWAESHLNGEAWYHYWLDKDYRRAANAYQVILLLDPQSSGAENGLKEAEKQIK